MSEKPKRWISGNYGPKTIEAGRGGGPAYFLKEVIGRCTLYLGDCRDILPTLELVDAVVTDPPYGISAYSTGKMGAGVLAKQSQYVPTQWDSKPVDDDLIEAARSLGKWQIIFGGNYYSLPPTSCWLVWDKVNGENNFADCELAWTNLPKAVRMIKWMWHGMLRDGKEKRGDHPTQKPIKVMEWCLDKLPEPNVTILDPFMGSGTTGVACAKMGRSFIGIEIDEGYFNIACQRIEDAYRQGDMFLEDK